jgi:P27 family predicted phage terminase small subunit
MRGRKPIPPEMHIAMGTYRADRHGGRQAQPREGIPRCPSHLDKTARVEYRRVSRLLAECRVITEADLVPLACYAQAWSRLVEAEGRLKETGLVVKSPAGFPCISPYLSIVRGATEELRRWSVELGLTPSARTKIKAVPKQTAPRVSNRRNVEHG